MNSYIKSAKQLHYTYITNDCPVKIGVYHELCAKFGIPERGFDLRPPGCFEVWPLGGEFVVYGVKGIDRLDRKSKELFLADMVDLHNSYVITTSIDVVRKFTEMCGFKEPFMRKHKKHAVVSYGENGCISMWPDCSGARMTKATSGKMELSESLINAMYDEMIKNEKLNKEHKEKMNTENKGTIKPNNTKIDYVPVTDSIFDLKDEFRKGLLFASKGRAVPEKITCALDLAKALYARDCLRAVERQMNWQEQVEFFAADLPACEGTVLHFDALGGNSVAIDGSISHQNFLELCRVALRATGELDAEK